ncbi:MAG TPA: DUF4189 domain-containing protein [Gemmataceae bacterium]|nr:DUF4189 domain-containing protein [Gemmataceae bacterium]
MNALRNVRFAVLTLVLSAAGALATVVPAHAADGDTYAAIVFSANGKYGYAREQASKDDAIDNAKVQCQATGELTAVWVKNGYVVLAISDNDVVDADAGRTKEEAIQKVTKRIQDAGGVNVHIVAIVNSDAN